MLSSLLTTADLVTRCRPLLGTFVEIMVPEGFEAEVDSAFEIVRHIHNRMSFHDPRSDLATLRRALPNEHAVVDPETVEVLRTAISLHQETEGLFDVTVGRRLVSCGFLPRLDITSLQAYNGTAADISIEDDTHVRLRRRVLIDLGGIAKGYAVDRAVEVLTAEGVPHGLVNAGGDLRGFGPKNWPIALRDADHIVRSQITICDSAVASSANLHERRTWRGRQVSPHVGRGGKPALSGKRITVLAPRCVIADAMTKVALSDIDLADALLRQFGGHVSREATDTF